MNRFVCTVLILLTCGLAAGQSTDPEPELAVMLRSMKSSYRITEEIQLEVELLNAGHRSFLIRRQLGWGPGRTNIGVFDSKGKQVVTTVLADELLAPPVAEDFLKLGPHEFFGVLVQEPITNFVNGPGTYQFVVNYTSRDSDEWVHDHLKLPAVRLPIRLLATKTNGWHDIGVVGRKSGNEPLYEAVLSFDGKSYPFVNDADELPLDGKVHGKIAIPASAKAIPLYH